MERISRGFRLLRASWEVLKADRELFVLPILSFVAVAVVAGLLGVAAVAGGVPKEGEQLSALHYLLIGLFYYCAYFIGIFANAAVVGAATIRLQGGDPTVRDGLRLAAGRVGKIAAWAAVAASVGLILRALEERAGFLGRIVIAVVGAAWSAITFFVVPVLLYEPLGVGESVKRSASLFRQRWGEQFTGNISIGLALALIMIPVVLVVVALGTLSIVLAIVVGVVAVGLISAAGAALSGVFNAALYRYAVSGDAVGGFSEDDLRGSFRPRR